MKIAIVGTGIAGMAAAWLLHKKYDITVFEKNDYIGGHSHTVVVDYDGKRIPVDTGFIVFNHATYPHLKALFEHLKVPTQKSDMSFGISVKKGTLEYAGINLASLFARPANALDPRFWRMLWDIVYFNREARKFLEAGNHTLTLGEYLDSLGVGNYFRQYYLLPMAGAIWSCSLDAVLQAQAETFLRFFHNHGLLTVLNQPQWYTVTGGVHEYVKRLTAPFADNINLSTKVVSILRADGKVIIENEQGKIETFDQVIIAAHGDETYRMLRDKSADEEKILRCFTYQRNRAVLHRDSMLMPKRKAAWASWVYSGESTGKDGTSVCVTYWMNKLQSIDKNYPLFVTLNPIKQPAKGKIFGEFIYDHPVYDAAAIAAQQSMHSIQGQRNTWFCGSYHRYGFHEDALQSALYVARGLGVKAPWL